MDLKNLRLSPKHFSIKIKNFEILEKTKEEETIYNIEIIYSTETVNKNWEITRNYTQILKLHNIITKKFDKAPYLPCKIIPELRKMEKNSRLKLLETYMNICIKIQEILNSLELRLFFSIEENLNIFLNPLIRLKSFELDQSYPINCNFWNFKRTLLVLTSEDDPNSNFQQFKDIFNSVTNFFNKKEKNVKGCIYILKELYKNSLNFEIVKHKNFYETPTFMDSNENLEFICVGFKSGKIETYWLKKNNVFEKFNEFKLHKSSITNLKCIENNGIIISTCLESMININDFEDEHGFSKNITKLNFKISAFFYLKKKKLLFLGDIYGNMTVYKIKNKNETEFLFNKKMKDSKIKNFSLTKNDKYLFIGFADSSIEVFDLSDNFKTNPVYINIWELDYENHQIFMSFKKKYFLVNFGEGYLAFCDNEDPSNFFVEYLHKGIIFDFCLFEKDFLIFSVGADKKLKISIFNDKLNSDVFPKNRGIKIFDDNIEFFALPNENDIINYKKKDEKNNLKENVKLIKENVDDDEEESLIGWSK